ncbi:MAG: alpha/beta fold hydrolase, partial [Brevundimonas sp.]
MRRHAPPGRALADHRRLHRRRARGLGAHLWYGVIGSGPPVILLHGGLSSHQAWGRQVPALLDAGYQVILIDSRGHGRSTLGSTPLSYDQLA